MADGAIWQIHFWLQLHEGLSDLREVLYEDETINVDGQKFQILKIHDGGRICTATLRTHMPIGYNPLL